MRVEQDLVYVHDEEQPLPNGWKITTLEGVISDSGLFCDGDWVESKDQNPNGDVRLIQLADIGVAVYRDRSDRYLTSERASELSCTFLQRGDILVARMPDPLGRACLFPGDKKRAVTVVDVAVVRPINLEVDSRWLMHRINSMAFRNAVASLQSGSTRLRISRRNLSRIAFPLPPLGVQLAAVDELEKQFSRLDEAVANLQRVKANLKRYKASVLKAAVEGRLVETEATLARREGRTYETGEQLLRRILEERRAKWAGRGKYKEPVGQTAEFTIAVPDGWTSATVDQLGNVQLGKMLDKQKHTAGAPYRYLRNINVRWGKFDVSDVFEMNFEADELERFSVRAGDVLVCEGGEPARAAVWRSKQADMKYQKALHRVRFDGAFLSGLLVIALEHMAKSGALDELYGGSTIKHFTRETFVKLVLPVPPIAEQARIVAEVDRHLSIIREVETEVDANLQRAQALRQSTLAKAFGHG